MKKRAYIVPRTVQMRLQVEGMIAASGNQMKLNEDHLKEEFANKKNPIWK